MSKIQQILSSKQIQELSLRPKMLQSLQMLALPQMELEMQIKRELELNPILEIEDEEEERTPQNGEDEETAQTEQEEEKGEQVDDLIYENLKEIKELSDILDSWNDYQKDGKADSDTEEKNIFDSYNSDKYDQFLNNSKNEFISQVEELTLSPAEMLFAKELLESIDEFGYLEPDVDIYDLGYEYFGDDLQVQDAADKKLISRVDDIHRMIMSLNPQGITARTVAECLLAQIPPQDNEYRILKAVLEKHFEDLIHRRYQTIASGLSVSLSKVHHLKDKISRLNPKPGLQLLSHHTDYVIPDVIIKKVDDEYAVIVNDYNVPHLTISSRYRSMLKTGNLNDRQTLSFIRDKINSAKFVIKSIYMRSRTIKRVVWSIIEHQKGFFYKNSGVLEPLTYHIIASDLNISESTVSRVVRNKYADTPFGVFCLKDFFTSTAGRTDDYEDVSRQNVEKHIVRMILEEDKNSPVSDLEMAEALKDLNINVSRRVIAKYRESLGILNSRLRRIQSDRE